MKHLMQEPNSSNCGQVCLAMITGRPVDYIEKIIGRQKPWTTGTNTRQLVNALKKVQYNPCSKHLIKFDQGRGWIQGAQLKTGDDIFHIFKMTFIEKCKHGHWVVMYKDKIYDPGQDGPIPYFHYKRHLEHYFRPTSYLEVRS